MNKQSHQPLLHVEILGKDGPPLLLLHGWGQNLENVKPLGELLSSNFQVHLIDLPGFGQSPMPPETWSAFDYAERLMAYLDEQHISQVDMIGHSFGGKVSLCSAIRYPERIKRLVLMSPSGIKKKRTLAGHCRFKVIRWSGKILKGIDACFGSHWFKSYFTPRFGSTDYQKAGALRPILVRSVNEDLSPLIPQIQAQTLLLWGEKDQETPLEIGYRLQNMIKNAALIALPYHGHMPFQDVGAHLCASYILSFLQAKSRS